ncbi:MAG: nucleotidyltransferase domain-containing protein [Candidatus Brockarchaeota archaeon]|nr:nucleotidyltransferase domain-containing protein [Candidatus Brockarchaeota archaeon]
MLKDEVLEISLFGSVARGTDAEGSDIDPLIIVSGKPRKALDAMFDKLGDILELAEKGIIVENVVENVEEWKKMEEKGFSFPRNMKDDRIVLYRRS